jgi:hypothetical protein
MSDSVNLFRWATSELSQDAFICWMLSWADMETVNQDAAMHHAGVAFLNAILVMHGETPVQNTRVYVRKQLKAADIVAEVGDDRVVLIEDKTETSDHGDQLERYVAAISAEYPGRRVLPIYCKTGDQANYKSALGAGYKLFLRRDVLRTLRTIKSGGLENAIFIDFLLYMEIRERATQRYKNLNVESWDGYAWQGFFMALQDELHELDWGYVPNPSGGFMGAWWHFDQWSNCDTYLQIEEQALCMKMALADEELDSSARARMRDRWFDTLKQASEGSSVTIERPARRGNGSTMTAARVGANGPWIQKDLDGHIDLVATVAFLRKAMSVLDRARSMTGVAGGSH